MTCHYTLICNFFRQKLKITVGAKCSNHPKSCWRLQGWLPINCLIPSSSLLSWTDRDHAKWTPVLRWTTRDAVFRVCFTARAVHIRNHLKWPTATCMNKTSTEMKTTCLRRNKRTMFQSFTYMSDVLRAKWIRNGTFKPYDCCHQCRNDKNCAEC